MDEFMHNAMHKAMHKAMLARAERIDEVLWELLERNRTALFRLPYALRGTRRTPVLLHPDFRHDRVLQASLEIVDAEVNYDRRVPVDCAYVITPALAKRARALLEAMDHEPLLRVV